MMDKIQRSEYKRLEDVALRERSRSVNSKDPLVSFLYDLLRDYVPAGKVEKMVNEATSFRGTAQYSNGYIAEYAQDVAKRLRKKL